MWAGEVEGDGEAGGQGSAGVGGGLGGRVARSAGHPLLAEVPLGRPPVDGGQRMLALGVGGVGQQDHEPVVDRVAVPDRLDGDEAAGQAGGQGGQGVLVEGAVGGAGDAVTVVEVAVVDDVLGVGEAETVGAAGGEDGADRWEEGVLKDVSVDLRTDAAWAAAPTTRTCS